MEIEVNGKTVVLRTKLPAKANWDLMKKFENFNPAELEFDEVADVIKRFVESWELDGDPKDTDSWEDIDMFTELFPIVKAVTEFIGQASGGSKN